MGRPNKALTIDEADRLQLQAMVRSRSMPHSLVRRARIILLSGTDSPIGKWRGAVESAHRRLAIGADAIRTAGWRGRMTNCGRADLAHTMTKRWRS